MKKTVLFFILLIAIIILPLITITKLLDLSVHQNLPISYLSVKELTGMDTIYVDNTKVGTTPFINKAITSGIHTILIKRTNQTTFYTTFKQNIAFQPNTNNFINIQLGPNPPFTFYSIFALKKTTGKTGLLIKTLDENKSQDAITVNDIKVKENMLLPEQDGNAKLLFQNANYLPYNSDITITDGYVLEAVIHPFKKPL